MREFPRCLTHPTPDSSFAGFPAAQSWNDLALWETFLSRYPVASILELGTWKGGMAVFLALQCRARGASFTTVDRDLGQVEPQEMLGHLDATILAVDLHGPEGIAQIRAILDGLPKPTLLFCDDGNKRMERRSFVPLLEPGDFAAVHDWNSEFGETDLDPVYPFELKDEAESIQSHTRFFQVT